VLFYSPTWAKFRRKGAQITSNTI